MAQLKDSTIDGNLNVTGDIILNTNEKAIRSVHPETGELIKVVYLSGNGNTIVGYDGYIQANGNSSICGKDVLHYVASAGNISYRPYYRAGDVISFTGDSGAIRTAGYVTNSGKNVVFTVPVSKPVIGSPIITVSNGKGFVFRQDGNYTHGSSASAFVKPTSYSAVLNPSGFVITAIFDVTTNVVNNDATGIYWDGKITLS
jgi:hypothetical protein